MASDRHGGPRRATYGALLRTPGVTPLYALALTTVLSTSVQIFALSVVVYRQTGSALVSSLAFAAGFLPHLVGGVLLTSLADRWPARPVLASGAVLRAASMGLLALVELPPWGAIALVMAVALWQPVPLATQSALVSRLLTGDLYVLGRSVFTVISSGAQLLGLAAGGALIALLGTSPAFVAGAALQLAGLLAVLAIPAQASGSVPPVAGRWGPGETWRGNLELLRMPVVRRILLSWWSVPLLLVGAEALVVAYVAEGGGAAGSTGLLLAAFPAGAAVGDLVVGRWFPPWLRRRTIPWMYAGVGVALLPLALQPAYVVVAACFAVASACTAYQLGAQEAFVDAVPESRRGLAFGLVGTGMMGGQGVGPLLAGSVADLVGAAPTISVLGVLILLTAPVLGRRPPTSPGLRGRPVGPS